jgi:hypothetical protein
MSKGDIASRRVVRKVTYRSMEQPLPGEKEGVLQSGNDEDRESRVRRRTSADARGRLIEMHETSGMMIGVGEDVKAIKIEEMMIEHRLDEKNQLLHTALDTKSEEPLIEGMGIEGNGSVTLIGDLDLRTIEMRQRNERSIPKETMIPAAPSEMIAIVQLDGGLNTVTIAIVEMMGQDNLLGLRIDGRDVSNLPLAKCAERRLNPKAVNR